ncbi:MAG: hypothetical protein KZQ81_08405 [Candidatus Thiodiazotropha sp. (ex Rostrolucina anterorostrata)]|nr:hypothetical protein [Candidatus Thiodiazotropha sp. (ex Rostrolucina anterorostrata)]
MASATERITILMSPRDGKRLISIAQNAGMSVSEYLRQAASIYRSTQDEQILYTLLEKMIHETVRAELAIDKSLKFVHESNPRIAKMESRTPVTRDNQNLRPTEC